jgi:aquaporin Z
MRRYATEFIGTFFLVLTVCTAVAGGSALAPLGIGAVLVVMVFAGGHVSGAHYNPAVTVALWARGVLPPREIVPYVVAQILGAVAASLVARLLVEPPGSAFDPAGRDLLAALVAELLFTFALAYVVLNVATATDNEGNSFYGLAIGFTVLAGAVALGGVSGAVFNPAVGTGVLAYGLIAPLPIVIFVLVQLAGGLAAGLVFRGLNPADVAVGATPPEVGESVQSPRLCDVEGPVGSAGRTP